jgi:hypothetical protein
MATDSMPLYENEFPLVRFERGDKYAYQKFTENQSPELVKTARRVHARSYRGEGFVYDEAIEEDGTIADDIDKARGSSVDYFLGYTLKAGTYDSVSTLRKINLESGETIDMLPGYRACQDALYPEQKAWLQSLSSETVSIKEISSFGHVPEVTALAGLELLRHVLQDSLGKGEVWFFTMVSEKYKTLEALFGPEAVRKIGDVVPLDDPRVGDVSLVPAVVDVDNFFAHIYEAAQRAEGPTRRRYLTYLSNFAEGVNEEMLGEEVSRAIAEFKKGLAPTPSEATDTFNFGVQAAKLKDTHDAGWRLPTQIDMHSASDRAVVQKMLEENEVRRVHDPAYADELFDVLHPTERHDDERRKAFIEEVEGEGEFFGKWFYFPWNRTLAHYPEKEQYQALRTFRNRSIITNEEQMRLLGVRPLVAGLSVGSKITRSLLHSGVGGAYILADFDTLSTTNLNRIHASGLDTEASKLSIQARMISEVDPYVDQVHLVEGVTEDTLYSLDRMPDILFDEVDDFTAKAILRQYARERKLPLIMATDVGDTTLLDIERYDTESPAPFNGRVNEKTFAKMLSGELTPEEKMRLMTRIIGLSNASFRLLDSVMDPALAGFPQLDTTASSGGAFATLAAREILLGSDVPSGRRIINNRKLLGLSSQTSLAQKLAIAKRFVTSKR